MLIPFEGLDADSGQVRKIFCESQVWEVRGSRGRKAIQSFRAQALYAGLRQSGAGLRPGFLSAGTEVPAYPMKDCGGARECVPFRILGFDGDGRERRARTRDAHISESRYGAPGFGEGVRCGPPAPASSSSVRTVGMGVRLPHF
jgi:hypothetical protein